MPDIVKIEYHQTGESVKNTANGMRPMAARAYGERNSQYLLIKAPPASGKSRALMFLALDKIRKQGLKKVIVAVPERSIAGSFAKADLKKDNNFLLTGSQTMNITFVRQAWTVVKARCQLLKTSWTTKRKF
jgi:hypothetical protein